MKARLTRPDGQPVWVDAERVTAITPHMSPNDDTSGKHDLWICTGSNVAFGEGHSVVFVKEQPDEVAQALAWKSRAMLRFFCTASGVWMVRGGSLYELTEGRWNPSKVAMSDFFSLSPLEIPLA